MALYKTVFFDFWFRPPNAQNLIPKICYGTCVMAAGAICAHNATLPRRHPWSCSRHVSSAWGKSAIQWTLGPTLLLPWQRNLCSAWRSRRLPACLYFYPFVHASDITRLCNISSWWIFSKLLSLVYLGHRWIGKVLGDPKRSQIEVSLSRRRRPALDTAVKWTILVICHRSRSHYRGGDVQHLTLPSSEPF